MAYAGLTCTSEAVDSLAEAKQLFTAEVNRLWMAWTDLEMAVLYLKQGRFEDGLKTAWSCARTFQEQGLPIRDARAHLIAARAAFRLK